MTEAVVPYGNDIPMVEGNPSHLITLALEKQADPKTLEKLMDLQERWEAGQGRRAYVLAMTAFKQEAPAVLKKNDRVDYTSAKGRTAYNYANLGSIVQEITAILGKHNLSASWATSQEGNDVTVTCHITHIAGHRESVTLRGPIDESGNKNRIQAVGSTVTYLQRYTLLAALGLATAEDDDGRGGVEKPKSTTNEPQPSQKANPAPDPRGIRITSVKSKDGTKQDGTPYTVYTILGDDGEKYGTFDEPHAGIAQMAWEQNTLVKIDWVKDKYGRKITGIEPVNQAFDDPVHPGREPINDGKVEGVFCPKVSAKARKPTRIPIAMCERCDLKGSCESWTEPVPAAPTSEERVPGSDDCE